MINVWLPLIEQLISKEIVVYRSRVYGEAESLMAEHPRNAPNAVKARQKQ